MTSTNHAKLRTAQAVLDGLAEGLEEENMPITAKWAREASQMITDVIEDEPKDWEPLP